LQSIARRVSPFIGLALTVTAAEAMIGQLCAFGACGGRSRLTMGSC
jgi:hypothetical protein